MLGVEAPGGFQHLWGQLDEYAPPVGVVAHAAGVPGPLEAIERGRHRPGRESRFLREPARGHAALALEDVEAAHVGAVEPERVGDGLVEAVQAHDLSKTYPPGVIALDGLSLAVRPGTIFGLLGPNGAGKSTTVRVLSTLSRPDSGRARVAGIDVLADPVRVRQAIGVVGQKHGSDLEATARENLVLQGEFYGITGRGLRQRVAESLARFGLTGAADCRVKAYSGGMLRRLDIAMGLLHRPQVLFLDEPSTGLDPEARVEM